MTTHDAPASAPPADPARRPGAGRPMLIFLVTVVVLAGAGFVFKLVEFIATFQEDPSQSFALMPVVTYLAVAAGFFCLLSWSVLSGHFRDMEAPKYDMLEREKELDREDAEAA